MSQTLFPLGSCFEHMEKEQQKAVSRAVVYNCTHIELHVPCTHIQSHTTPPCGRITTIRYLPLGKERLSVWYIL